MQATLDLTNLSESFLLSVVTRILARPGDDFTEAELDELTAITAELRRRNHPTLKHHATLTLLPVVVRQYREKHENRKARSASARNAVKARWAKARKAEAKIKRQLAAMPRLINRHRNN